MALDTVINEQKEIIGYKPINLIYLNIDNIKDQIKSYDGEYLINWIRI